MKRSLTLTSLVVGLLSIASVSFAASYICVESYFGDGIYRYNGKTGEFVDKFATLPSGLSTPAGMDMGPDGNIYVVTNTGNSVVRLNGTTGAYMETVVDGEIVLGSGLAFDSYGYMYVMDNGSQLYQQYTITGYQDNEIDGIGLNPKGITIAPNGNLMFNRNGNEVAEYTRGGDFVRVVTSSVSEGLDLTFGPDGYLYVAEFQNFTGTTVAVVDTSTGAVIDRLTGDGLLGASDVMFDPTGRLFVSSGATDEIYLYNDELDTFEYFASGGGLDGPFHLLWLEGAEDVIPEPVTIILFAASALGFCIRKLKK